MAHNNVRCSQLCEMPKLSKTEKALKLISSGDWKSGLQLIRKFRIGFTKEEMRIVEIASDVLNGHENFYLCLKIDTQKVVLDCKKIISEKYKVS